MAKNTAALAWMALEGRFLKSAGKRITKIQEKKRKRRAKAARVRNAVKGTQNIFSAHLILLAYRRRKLIIACVALFFAVPITSAIMTDTLTVYEYSYHGRVLGVVRNVEEVQSAVRMIEGTIVENGDKKAEVAIKSIEPNAVPLSAGGSSFPGQDGSSIQTTLDVPIPMDSSQAIEVKETLLVTALGKIIDTEEDVISNIVKQKDLEVKAYKVAINGDTLGVVGTREEAETLLAEIKDYWLGNTDSSKFKEIGFAEEVSVEEIASTLPVIEHSEALYDRAFEHVIAPKTYTVRKGETILDVALNNGVTEQQIYNWNPDIDPDSIGTGDTLIMEAPKAMMNIRTVEEGFFTAAVDFDTIYIENDELFLGEEEVDKPGVPGTKNAFGEIIRVDGEIVQYVERSSIVTVEPISAIVQKGTKPIPPRVGTGTFVVPIEGLVTSLYGPRWGRVHEGIDFGAPVGTAVRASDGGKVSFVGWDGSFGMTVKINHGGGYSTLYAHLSSTSVVVGEDVHQGQQIAHSGNTGFSTGPHLHFGIYKFDKSEVTMDYLPTDMPTYLLSGVQLD
jgi:murein DD-endopeptidase MepM/ murein hydrolase activator NlpD